MVNGNTIVLGPGGFKSQRQLTVQEHFKVKEPDTRQSTIVLGPGGFKSQRQLTAKEIFKEIFKVEEPDTRQCTIVGQAPSGSGASKVFDIQQNALYQAELQRQRDERALIEETRRIGRERQAQQAELQKNIKNQQNALYQAELQKQRDEKALIEETRRIGRERQAQQAESQKLVTSLRARESLTAAAKERGRGFSATETRAFLKTKGTSVGELRQATKASRKVFRKTGVSVQEQIKQERLQKQELAKVKVEKEAIDKALAQRKKDIGITGEVQPALPRTKFEFIRDLPLNLVRGTGKFLTTPLDVRGAAKSTLETVGGGLSIYQESVVRPLGEGGFPIFATPSFITPGGRIFKGGIIRTAPLIETPLSSFSQDIVSAKELVESKKPEELVEIGLPGQRRFVQASTLQGGGLLSFGGKIALGEITTALKDIVKTYEKEIIIPLSKTKFAADTKEAIVDPSVFAAKFYRKEIVGGLRKLVPSLGETPIGQIAQAKRIIESKQPGETVTIGLPGQRRQVDVGLFQDKGLIGFGEEVFLGEVETAFTDIARASKFDEGGVITSEQFGKGVRFTTAAGFLALPGFFESQTAVKILEATTGGPLGGPKSATQFVIENPLEVTLATTAAISTTAKAIKAARVKRLSEFVVDPLKKTTILEQKISKEVTKPSIIKPRLELSTVDDIVTFEIKPKTKGRILSTEFISEPGQIGSVTELRTIKGKTSVYKGLAEVSGADKLKETIKFGKITRITELEKTGEGTVKLLKGKKIIFEQGIKKGDLPELIFGKPSISKILVDKQTGGQGLKIEELKIFGKGKRSRVSRILDEKGNLVLSDTIPSLKSKLVTAKLQTVRRGGKDISKGVQQLTETQSGFIDVIGVGPRKALFQTSTPEARKTFLKRFGQTIEFGQDKTIDEVLFFKQGGKTLSAKIITPKVTRDISEFTGTRNIIGFTNPNTKAFKQSQKLLAKGSKANLKRISDIDKGVASAKFDKLVGELTEESLKKGRERRELISGAVSKVTSRGKTSIPDTTIKQSDFAFGQKFNLPSTVYVEPTEQFLKGRPPVQSPATPIFTGVTVSTRNLPLSFTPLSQARIDLSTQQPQVINQIIQPKVASETKNILKSKNIQSQLQPVLQIVRPTAKINQKIIQEQLQSQKQVLKQVQKQTSPQQPIIRRPIGIGFTPGRPTPPPEEPIIRIPKPFFKSRKIKIPKQSFGVQVRRGGKFSTIARTKDLRKALSIGSQRVGSTLAATFRIKGVKTKLPTLAGFRRKGDLFIEKRGKRLSKRGETKEIQRAKKTKPKRRKKK